MYRRSSRHPALAAALVLTTLAACDQGSDPVTPELQRVATDVTAPVAVPANAEVSSWLAALRGATAPFQRIEVASDAGWDTAITGCMESGEGGMGYHYANGALFDGVADELAPETLLYEPQKNGRLRLVGVEYIVPFTSVPADAPAPSLHGVAFHQNQAFGLWALHAWVWKHNPNGVFEDWNPTVTCAFAQ